MAVYFSRRERYTESEIRIRLYLGFRLSVFEDNDIGFRIKDRYGKVIGTAILRKGIPVFRDAGIFGVKSRFIVYFYLF